MILLILIVAIGYYIYMYPFAKGVVDDASKKTTLKNQRWIHEQDSLAGIEIKDQKWIFFYKGEKITEDDIYRITLTNKLPQFVKTGSNLNEFITLTNQSDTLYYEIMGHNDKILSLLSFPNGRFHVYVPEKP